MRYFKMRLIRTEIVDGTTLAKIKTSRAAAVPYVNDRGSLKFLLAIDRKSKELGDLGGGVKKYEFSLCGALRELKEESRNLFTFNANDCTEYVSVYDINKKLAVIFIPVPLKNYKSIPERFKEKSLSPLRNTKKEYNEISDLVWINETKLYDILYQNEKYHFWKRLVPFYLSFINQIKEPLKRVYNSKYGAISTSNLYLSSC